MACDIEICIVFSIFFLSFDAFWCVDSFTNKYSISYFGDGNLLTNYDQEKSLRKIFTKKARPFSYYTFTSHCCFYMCHEIATRMKIHYKHDMNEFRSVESKS